MDKTSWKLLNYGFVTIAKRGSKTVDCLFDNDPKMCLTTITAIDAARGKFALWVLYHGKTERCENRCRDIEVLERSIRHGELVLSHQENGWTNAEVILDYFRWLRSRFAEGEIVLMWDVYTAHRAEEVKSFAQEIGIRLEFIPLGMTAECQPLDRRIFGNLEAQVRRRFNDYWAVNQSPSVEDSIAMLLTPRHPSARMKFSAPGIRE
jgi:hypothetical protein